MTTSAQRARASGSAPAGAAAGPGPDRISDTDLWIRRILARVLDLVPVALLFAALWVAGSDVLETESGACDPAPAPNCNVVSQSDRLDGAGNTVIEFTMADGRVIDSEHTTYQIGDTVYIADPPTSSAYLVTLGYVVLVFVVVQGITGWTPGKLAGGLRLADGGRRSAGLARAFLRWALPDGVIGMVGVTAAVIGAPWPLHLLAVFAPLGLLRFVGELVPAVALPTADDRLGVGIVARDDFIGGRPERVDEAPPEAVAEAGGASAGAPGGDDLDHLDHLEDDDVTTVTVVAGPEADRTESEDPAAEAAARSFDDVGTAAAVGVAAVVAEDLSRPGDVTDDDTGADADAGHGAPPVRAWVPPTAPATVAPPVAVVPSVFDTLRPVERAEAVESDEPAEAVPADGAAEAADAAGITEPVGDAVDVESTEPVEGVEETVATVTDDGTDDGGEPAEHAALLPSTATSERIDVESPRGGGDEPHEDQPLADAADAADAGHAVDVVDATETVEVADDATDDAVRETSAAPQYTPQWDEARQAYICWEPVAGRWLQWDDDRGVWGPISQ